MSEPTGARRYGVGGGDAYYDAVRYGGYEGTREQFGRDQAKFAENAAAVAEAKEVVEQDTEEVRSTKDTFVNTTVPEAITAIQQEGADQVQAIIQQGEESSQQVEAVGTQWKDEVANEGDTQVQRVIDVGDEQVGRVEEVIDPYIQQAEQAQAAAEAAQRESETAAQHAQELMDTLPEDYSDMLEDVSGLNETKDIRTVSGDIVSFDSSYADMPLKKLTINIEPVQSGSGDPSPDNVRPITGWTGANVHHTGKNMYDPSIIIFQRDADGKFTTGSDTGSVIVETGQPSSSAVISDVNYKKLLGLPAGHYCGYVKCHYNSAINIGTIRTVSPVDKKTTNLVSLSTDSNGNCTFDFTLTEYTKIVFRLSQSNLYYSNLMIAPYSLGAEYEPYQGTAYPISWETEAGTVYGGTLTVNEDGSVDLNVTRCGINITSETTIASSKVNRAGIFSANYTLQHSGDVSSEVREKTLYSHGTIGNPINAGNYLQANSASLTSSGVGIWIGASSSVEDLTGYNIWLATNEPLQFVYPLAEPITYHLDSIEQIYTLAGENNIWADISDVEVQYGEYISMIKNELGEKVPKLTIAPIEKTTTASKAYVVNELLIMGNKLYIVTANIASGGTITIGTNVSETTIGALITALLNA